MPPQMDESYFDEKKESACGSLNVAIQETTDALTLIQATRYAMLDLVSADQVHENLRIAEGLIRNARRDYEKSRWAAARTETSFDEWMKAGPGNDLTDQL